MDSYGESNFIIALTYAAIKLKSNQYSNHPLPDLFSRFSFVESGQYTWYLLVLTISLTIAFLAATKSKRF